MGWDKPTDSVVGARAEVVGRSVRLLPAATTIVEEREKNGPYADMSDRSAGRD
jgi:hypothetical protein